MAEKIIVDADDKECEWFCDANKPFTAIANMLINLDDKGLIPTPMRRAIYRHAENSIETLPLSVAASAASIAGASSGSWLGTSDVASAAYGVQSLAELMNGWAELANCFGTEREVPHV